jgi:Zn-dependent protease
MLTFLRLPIELLRIAFYALSGLNDVLRGRERTRIEITTEIKAPRDAVWRMITADRMVLEGPPHVEFVRESLSGDDGLLMTRAVVNGHECARFVCRELTCDEANGIIIWQIVAHELSLPSETWFDGLTKSTIEERPQGTALTTTFEMPIRSFRQRFERPLGMRQQAALLKQQCEKEAGTRSRLAEVADHGLVLSIAALLSFWYLVGLEDALLVAAIVVIHELGHAIAMRMVGIEVQGIYLIPFFGGAAVPKTSYRTEANRAFVALMGPGFSLCPALGLAALFEVTDNPYALYAAWAFAVMNASNLLPLYPLDGGLILNALLGSLSRRLALVTGWIGVLTGLGLALYWESLLIGIPFLLFAVQHYLSQGHALELEPLSRAGGVTLALAFVVTAALYGLVFSYSYSVGAQTASSPVIAPPAARHESVPAMRHAAALPGRSRTP